MSDDDDVNPWSIGVHVPDLLVLFGTTYLDQWLKEGE
jgi:hypothetical protein